ncbi:hypothetical protein PYCC9005_003709 [Savitreella phatthalungensis]
MRGDAADSEGAVLRGLLVLSLHDPIQARNITLTLRGRARVAWSETFTNASRNQSSRTQRDESIIYEHTWQFLAFSSHSKTIGVGNYEYPFEVRLPGDLPETVEGIDEAMVGYSMIATVERPGLATNITCKKRIRVVRTLSIDSLEMAQTLSVDNTWPNKIEYAISIPTKSYPIGSTVPVNFKLVPLLKGLSIAKITCQLKEYQSLSIEHGAGRHVSKKEIERTIGTTVIEDLEKEVTHWDVDEALQIPASLTQCVQDCEVKYLRVRHKIKFTVALLNPDGHVSELRAALPISLLIPPSIFGGSGQVDPNDPDNQLPSYETHIYDRLYDGIETPLPSGVNTPAARSRRGSVDVAGQLGQTSSATLDSEQHRHALLAGLNRLQLTSTGAHGTHTPPASVSHHSFHGTPREGQSGSTTPLQVGNASRLRGEAERHFSEDDIPAGLSRSADRSSARGSSTNLQAVHAAALAAETQRQQYMELQMLSRIPSYETAAHNPSAGPLSASLPDYDSPLNRSNAGSRAGTPGPGVTRAGGGTSVGDPAGQVVTGFSPASAAEHGLAPPPTSAGSTAFDSSLARPTPAHMASHPQHYSRNNGHGILRAAHDRLHITRARDH